MPSAVTMWDFSWLLRRSGTEAEYADVDRVLDELNDRGYDTVRIDAFPHWIAPDNSGNISETITASPQPAGFMWGNHTPVTVRPKDALLQFLSGLKDRGLQAGLSTWFTGDNERRNEQVRTPADLARVWNHTLQTIDDAGLTETIRYVDLCNEWPGWSPGVTQAIFDSGSNPTTRSWSPHEVDLIDSYQTALADLRADHPNYPLTLSWFPREVTTGTPEDLFRLSVVNQDLLEVHLWLSLVCPAFIKQTAYVDDYSSDVTNLTEHEHIVHETLDTDLKRWLAELDDVMAQWSEAARERGLPLWTTEGWASIGWSPDLEPEWSGWDYVKKVGEGAIELAGKHGWEGICTSNFSQPHHAGMWADTAWHKTMTERIRRGGSDLAR